MNGTLTYIPVAIRDGHTVKVHLNGKHIGSIRHDGGGWRYFPKGWTTGGDIYPTLAACKASLEAE